MEKIIFGLIILDLTMVTILMVICIKSVKICQHYVDEKEIEETMKRVRDEEIEVL